MRKHTREINIGNLRLGGTNPIRIQSMTNTKGLTDTINQVKKLQEVGCEIVRLSIPNNEAANDLIKIKSEFKDLPIVADIHFDYELAIASFTAGADCVRINPGNIGGEENFAKIVEQAKKLKKCIRIGVNAGSLEKELLQKYGHPTAEALAESALKWISFTEDRLQFKNFKVSVKSSNTDTLINSNKIISEKSDAPLHIGLTEAGTLISGLISSSLALSKILEHGIGDTIRISLSSDPVNEVIAGYELLKALNLRTGVKIISCPTCARTSIDVINLADKVQKEFCHYNKNIKVAVMGCIVNGPGEAKEADIGIAGGKDCCALFKDGEVLGRFDVEDAINKIREYIKEK